MGIHIYCFKLFVVKNMFDLFVTFPVNLRKFINIYQK